MTVRLAHQAHLCRAIPRSAAGEDLRQLALHFRQDEFLFGSGYVCYAVKP
jgi:hypothetical protein